VRKIRKKNKLLEVHGNEIPPSLEEMGVEIPVQAAPVVEAATPTVSHHGAHHVPVRVPGMWGPEA